MKEFTDYSEPGTRSCTVVMDEVVRRDNRQHNFLLDIMRKGEFDDDAIDYMLSRSLDNINNEEK